MKTPLQFLFLLGISFLSTPLFSQTVEKTSEPVQEKSAADSQPAQPLIASNPTVASNPMVATSGPDNFIPARTQVKFFLETAISTKTAVPGEKFQLAVAEDILINKKVLIAKGTPATGEVIHAQKAKGFGKAGELLVTIRYIDLNGQKIKMRSFQPFQGNNKSGEVMMMSMIPVAGLFSGFVQGGEIEMPAQTLVLALTATDNSIIAVANPAAVTIDNTETHPEDVNKITNGDSK